MGAEQTNDLFGNGAAAREPAAVPIIVTLTSTEMMVASYVGAGRNVQSLKQNWEPAAAVGLANTWTLNIEGAAGEMAVAKALGKYWHPVIGNHLADDVGCYQVRTNISRQHDDLCLRPKDRADRVYISVLSFAPEFHVLGWVDGATGKSLQWYRDGALGRPKCFYVPRDALRDLRELEQIADCEGVCSV